MKKLICLALCFVMAATIFAGCKADEGTVEETTLQVGYSREDVTPDYSMPLAGYGDNRPSTGALDPIYITCVALKDGEGNTFLMYHCDFLGAPAALLFQERKISKETGVPVENIITCGTHNHSAPNMDAPSNQYPLVEDYTDMCKDAMMKSAKAALADLKPAKVYVSSIKCEKMCNVRHYERDTGIVDDSSGYTGSNKYVGHPVPVDDNMELIKFAREGGKDVVLMNWQGHPRGNGKFDAEYFGWTNIEQKGYILSDVHAIRKTIEPALDCEFAFFLGASGNVSNGSWLKEERITSNYIEHGEKLTEFAVQAAANFKEVKIGPLRRKIIKVDVVKKDGFTEDTITISVFAIGKSVAFAAAPYEMFSDSALAIKAASDFECTFIATVAEGGGGGYMPSATTFDTSKYRTEPYEVKSTFYAEGTAERLVEGYKSILSDLMK